MNPALLQFIAPMPEFIFAPALKMFVPAKFLMLLCKPFQLALYFKYATSAFVIFQII
jgi:hypothetical protein